jgi:hypothetical protein
LIFATPDDEPFARRRLDARNLRMMGMKIPHRDPFGAYGTGMGTINLLHCPDDIQ